MILVPELTVERHTVIGGLDSVVAEMVCGLLSKRLVLYTSGLKDCFASIVGDHDYLSDYYGISAEKVAETEWKILIK